MKNTKNIYIDEELEQMQYEEQMLSDGAEALRKMGIGEAGDEAPEEPQEAEPLPQEAEPLDGDEEVMKEKSKIEKIEEWLFRRYSFRMNRTTCTLEFMNLTTDDDFRPFEDENLRDIVIELKKMKFSKPKDDLEDLLKSSRVPKFSPIKDYFHGLKLRTFGNIDRLADCVKVDDSLGIKIGDFDYNQLWHHYFKKWLIACYLCSMETKHNDVMLILIGAQGRFKTSFLNYLCPPALHNYVVCSHINPSLTDYNTANYLAEKMFLNIDDQMETIFGKDYNSMKAIVSAPDVTNRKLYSTSARKRTRIANLCGSVNEARFLRDSNNRRYLCFKIVDIDPDYRLIDMDQVWAEVAYEVIRTKSNYIFGRDDYANIDLMNAMFETPTEEAETLQVTFTPAEEGSKETTYLMSYSEIKQVLSLVTGNKNLNDFRLQTALRKYGYMPKMARTTRYSNPRNLYAVHCISTLDYVRTKVWEYLP